MNTSRLPFFNSDTESTEKDEGESILLGQRCVTCLAWRIYGHATNSVQCVDDSVPKAKALIEVFWKNGIDELDLVEGNLAEA
eukprot:scaffold823_cov219-Amphora_coffeaeformis.AAC.5